VTRPLKLQFNSIFCFAPPQFSEEIPWIHSARLDEALVTGPYSTSMRLTWKARYHSGFWHSPARFQIDGN